MSPQSAASAWTHLDLTTLRQKLLDLFCQGAYQEGNFTLSSGQSSSYYINGKLVTLHPQGAVAVGRLLLPQVRQEAVAVSGLTLGADPMISATSVVAAYEGRDLTGLLIRKEAKGHGTQAYLEGPVLAPGSEVAVLEDVVTTGQSALKAVQRLRDAGYVVTQILALVDRNQGGAELYQAEGLQFWSLFSLAEVQAHWKTLNPSV
ncbi:MAG: orotate phosphoribosyltransferase [Prochlorothrix sp.]|nr:orotate phosphoribosyltransferase [Prochlorothrix sp.]